MDRKQRVDKRQKLIHKHDSANPVMEKESNDEDPTDGCDGLASQADITMEALDIKFEQLQFASEKIESLKCKIEHSPLGLMDCISDTVKWTYYTGFEYGIVNQIIFVEVKPFIPTTSTTFLRPFNRLLLTLVKLRLNLQFHDLAYRFGIAPTTASTYFYSIIHILYQRLKSIIIWPTRSVNRKNIPSCFTEAFQDKTTIIVDCFEIFIEKPNKYLTQQQCWSNYKHHTTVKFLIGITPQGTISYISEAWGGRTSDRQMVELSDFCSHIEPGDIILADRGFLISESLGILGAKLVIPAFTKGQSQLHPIQIEKTRNIAHVRIHIERIIGLVKNKFRIFEGHTPISMVKKGEDGTNILDEILIVCSALPNLSPPIIPL